MAMSEKAKAAKAIYMKEWRRNNRDKTKKHNATYWEKKVMEKINIEKQAFKLYKRGLSINIIAEKIGMTYEEVSSILNSALLSRIFSCKMNDPE